MIIASSSVGIIRNLVVGFLCVRVVISARVLLRFFVVVSLVVGCVLACLFVVFD